MKLGLLKRGRVPLSILLSLSQNEGVSAVNDPQIWSVVGLLAAFATVTFGMQRFNNRSLERMIVGLDRSVDARIGGLEQSVNARIDGLDQSVNARFDAFDAKFTARIDGLEESVNARFDAFDAKFTARVDGLAADVGHRLDNVERDLTLIKGHLLEQQRS